MAGFWDMAEGDGLPALSGGRGKYVRFDVIRWMTARMAPKKYCEKVLVEAEFAARQATEVDRDRRLKITLVDFRKGPNGEVLVAPPRTPAEAAAWERAYGTPYDGQR